MPIAPRVAYLVLSHGEPAILGRLCDRLLRGDPHCRVIVDHEIPGPSLDGALPVDGRLTVRRSVRPGGWGGYGLVSAVLDAAAAIRRELDPDWFVLLSGSDYPARPPAEIAERLAASPADVHLTVLRRIVDGRFTDDMRWWHARYFFRWFALPRTRPVLPASLRTRRRSLQHRVSTAQPWWFVWTLPRGSGTRVGVRRRRTPFDEAYPCWAAYQWLAISRRGLETLEAELGRRPELGALYRRSVIPDESMIQTILLNAPGLRHAQPNLTYQRSAGFGDAHAAVLTLEDLPAITASGRAFARKMDPTASAGLMDALDRRLGLGATERAGWRSAGRR